MFQAVIRHRDRRVEVLYVSSMDDLMERIRTIDILEMDVKEVPMTRMRQGRNVRSDVR